MASDTPRTDAAEDSRWHCGGGEDEAMVGFARQLERELAEARRALVVVLNRMDRYEDDQDFDQIRPAIDAARAAEKP